MTHAGESGREPSFAPATQTQLHCLGLQGRRILLLFAIGLLVTAAAASLVPVPEAARDGEGTAEPEAAGDSSSDTAIEVRFSADDRARALGDGAPPTSGVRGVSATPTETVARDERVVVTVTARAPGEVFLDGLGRVESVGPRTPAVFDLFTDTAGRFDVLYTPVDGAERPIGTLAVGSEAPGSGDAGEPAVDRE